MAGMGIQERYNDIAQISGLSEEIIRRVFKATRQSIVKSFKRGEKATIPGICTITPEVKRKLNIGGDSMTSYIKLKASASPALTTELEKVDGFVSKEDEDKRLADEELGLSKLNMIKPELPRYNPNSDGIITTQIGALL